MENLKRITKISIILYAVFILLNLLELAWFSYRYFIIGNRIVVSGQMNYLEILVKSEHLLHKFLNFGAYIMLLIQLFVFNGFVKRNDLGKSYHFLIILLSFVPLVNSILFFILWKKLNRSIFKYLGADSQKTDGSINCLWIYQLGALLVSFLTPFIFAYLISIKSFSKIIGFQNLFSILHSSLLLIISFIYMSYYLNVKKAILAKENEEVFLVNNGLID